MSAKKACFVIINPISGSRKGKKQWPKIQQLLSLSFKVDYSFTAYHKHEMELAKIA